MNQKFVNVVHQYHTKKEKTSSVQGLVQIQEDQDQRVSKLPLVKNLKKKLNQKLQELNQKLQELKKKYYVNSAKPNSHLKDKKQYFVVKDVHRYLERKTH